MANESPDSLLTLSENDASFGEIVRRQFNPDLIAGHDTDKVFSHPSGHMGHYLRTGFQLHTKPRVG